MIGRLSGTLVEKNPPQILLDVQGVAYEVDVPMSTFYNLPGLGERVVLFTHLVVREDAHLLYGFGSDGERKTFGDELTDEAAAACAEREAQSDFGSARSAARQQKVGQIRTRDVGGTSSTDEFADAIIGTM